ncbi:MAG TPA: protein-S-isoprenylcysteine O-methyltransferase [Roseiflexaceae bacterium]|nr:protein-S-isoprenylcysteine O-methyltransferase [Roseiflexaceae bacterium]
MDRYFKLVYFAGMLAEIVLRRPYDQQRRQIAKIDQRVSAKEQVIFGGLSLGLLLLPLLYSLTRWLDRANYNWPPARKARMGMLGTLCMAGAVWLFWRSHHDLGHNWSPSLEIGSNHTLVTAGVYRYVRHPMYSSQLLWGIAQALLLQNAVAGWPGFMTFLALYLLRIPDEERMMRDHFGEQYRCYAARTGRILPRMRNRQH